MGDGYTTLTPTLRTTLCPHCTPSPHPTHGLPYGLADYPHGLLSRTTLTDYPQGKPSRTTLPYPTIPYPTLPYPTLPYPTLPYPTLPYPTLPYPTLPYPTLPYPVRNTLRLRTILTHYPRGLSYGPPSRNTPPTSLTVYPRTTLTDYPHGLTSRTTLIPSKTTHSMKSKI